MKISSTCQADGFSMEFTRTITTLPAGIYELRANVRHERDDSEACGDQWRWSTVGFRVNGWDISPNYVSCGQSNFQGRLSGSNIVIKGDGTDTVALYAYNNGCASVAAHFDDLAFRRRATVSPAQPTWPTPATSIIRTLVPSVHPTDSLFTPSPVTPVPSVSAETAVPKPSPPSVPVTPFVPGVLEQRTGSPAVVKQRTNMPSETFAMDNGAPMEEDANAATASPTANRFQLLIPAKTANAPSEPPFPTHAAHSEKPTRDPASSSSWIENEWKGAPTELPSLITSVIPSDIPSEQPTPHLLPVKPPSKSPNVPIHGIGPTENPDKDNNSDKIIVPNLDAVPFVDETWVYEVALTLTFASRLAQPLNDVDIENLERTVSKSCLEFYASYDGTTTTATAAANDKASRQRDRHHHYHRSLESQSRRRNARDVLKADIVFVRQKMSYDDTTGLPENTITYNQHFVFNPNPNVSQEPGSGPEDDEAELYTPVELSKLPFNQTEWNMRLGNELKEDVPTLKDVKLPLEVPIIPNQAQFQLTNDSQHNGPEELSEGAIASIFLAVAFIFTCVGINFLRKLQMANQAVKQK